MIRRRNLIILHRKTETPMDVPEHSKDYKRKIDKTQIPTCNILGVEIAAINMRWLLEFIEKNIKVLSGDYICVSNVHTTITAYEDEGYRRIQNGGIMAIPDGGPLSSIGRRHGHPHMERITGPDYMEAIMKLSIRKGYSHYFYGSTVETLSKLRQYLDIKYPGIRIVGMYSPPFRPMTKDEEHVLVGEINNVQPDFIWVGLGAPKQERWMAIHQGHVHGLMVGVGAAFDYLAGNIKRAPKWMQKTNLEWLYRLMQDPERLFKRYLHTNIKFLWKIMFNRK